MILRAKNKDLFSGPLNKRQKSNTQLNVAETEQRKSHLASYPRRIVVELTNDCNLNCIMCGREHAYFKSAYFKLDWLKKIEPAFSHSEEIVLHGWGEPTIHADFGKVLEFMNRFPVRKYFCTNGMMLDFYFDDLFSQKVDILAVSLDGANRETNDRIRAGGDFHRIIDSLTDIVAEKRKLKLDFPYMNFVFTAMRSNIAELPELVKLAADIGVQEVKVVYLTVFSEELSGESLYGMEEDVNAIFKKAESVAENAGILLKLPYIQGLDPAGDALHRECWFPYRDLFIGSDGYVRPCVSSGCKLYHIDDCRSFDDIWNHEELKRYRKTNNDIISMPPDCSRCYHSSCGNWNNLHAFIQIQEHFSPEWE